MDRRLFRWPPPPAPPAPDREERFVRLLQAHERRLRAYIFSLVPNWSDADDLLQETAAVIWRKFDQFEDGTNFLAWAMSVARNEVLNHRRRQAGRPIGFCEATFELLAREAATAVEGSDARRDALEGCLAKLGPRDRELVHLRYQPGANTRQVADQVGRAPKAVYKTLNRIHLLLLECVRKTLAAEGRR